jgi:phage-related tail fiber protein
MRKLLVPFLIVLAVPATALSRPAPPQPLDGTLSIREGRGIVQLTARGTITGRFTRGKLTVTDPNPYDAKRPVVYGASKTTYRGAKTTIYQGRNIRFRLSGAQYSMKIDARGIFLSAIARGRGLVDGIGDVQAGIFYDGVWSLNDEVYHSLPDEPTAFQLVAPPVPQ